MTGIGIILLIVGVLLVITWSCAIAGGPRIVRSVKLITWMGPIGAVTMGIGGGLPFVNNDPSGAVAALILAVLACSLGFSMARRHQTTPA